MKRYALYLMIMVLLGATGAWGQEVASGGPADGQGAQLAEAQDQDTEAVNPGDEWSSGDEAWEEEAEELPPMHYVLEPVMITWLGFRIVDVQGSKRAMEYGWPSSSPTGGIKLHYSPLPHRIDFELDMKNHNDYDAEVTYAFRDIFKLDYRGWALYHNLDHQLPQPGPTDRNPGDSYHVTARDNRVFLRLKWPDRAYHLFAEFRQFEKEGTVQQMADAGGRVAKSRDIDWITRKYTAGVNGHFGPVELEFSHRIKTFDPHKEVAAADIFSGNLYNHSVTPELESRSENVKVHTDLTGRIVASATYVNGDKKNNHTHAEVDFNRAYADLVLIPVEHLTIAFKYRFKDLRVDSPEFIDDPKRGIIFTEDPIDSRTHQAGVTMRYTPMNELGIKLEYLFESVKKDEANLWSEAIGPGGERIFPFQDLPSIQNIHTVKLGANVRPVRSLSAKGSVEYSYTDDPAYPTKAQNAFKGRFDVDWMPHYSVNMDTYYRFQREENNSANMKFERDNIGTLLTWVPLDRLSFFASYDYTRFRNERDIRLVGGLALASFTLLPVDHIPYTDTSHFYSVGTGYTFSFPLSVDAEFHQCWTKGIYRTTVAGGGIGERSDLRVRETGGSVNVGYDLPKGWGLSAGYEVNDYQDLEDKPQNGVQDGLAHTVTLLVKKEW